MSWHRGDIVRSPALHTRNRCSVAPLLIGPTGQKQRQKIAELEAKLKDTAALTETDTSQSSPQHGGVQLDFSSVTTPALSGSSESPKSQSTDSMAQDIVLENTASVTLPFDYSAFEFDDSFLNLGLMPDNSKSSNPSNTHFLHPLPFPTNTRLQP